MNNHRGAGATEKKKKRVREIQISTHAEQVEGLSDQRQTHGMVTVLQAWSKCSVQTATFEHTHIYGYTY